MNTSLLIKMFINRNQALLSQLQPHFFESLLKLFDCNIISGNCIQIAGLIVQLFVKILSVLFLSLCSYFSNPRDFTIQPIFPLRFFFYIKYITLLIFSRVMSGSCAHKIYILIFISTFPESFTST